MAEKVVTNSSDYITITKETNSSKFEKGFLGIVEQATRLFKSSNCKEMYLYKTIEGYHMLPKYYTDIDGDCWKISDKGIFPMN